MKNLLSIILVLLMVFLVGCSGEKSTDETKNSNDTSQTVETTVNSDNNSEVSYSEKDLEGTTEFTSLGIDKPLAVRFPKNTMPRNVATGGIALTNNNIVPLCDVGMPDLSPEFGDEISSVKENKDIIPAMKSTFIKLVHYYKSSCDDDTASIEISAQEDISKNGIDACHNKGTISFSAYKGNDKIEVKWQFVAYSFMWDDHTPVFCAVIDATDEQNKIDECQENLEFMFNNVREVNHNEYH